MGETGVVQQDDDHVGRAGGRQDRLGPPGCGLAGGASDDWAISGRVIHAFSVAQAAAPAPTGDGVQAI